MVDPLPVVTDNSTAMKAVMMLAARRIAAYAGVALVSHGLAISGDPNLPGFVEILSGIILCVFEFALEWGRNKGMVMITTQLARIKGVPLPHEPPAPPVKAVTPAGAVVPVEVKSTVP